MMDRLRLWRIYWSAWALLAMYYTSWDVLAYKSPILKALPLNVAQNLVWSLLGLVVLWVADRMPIESFSIKAWKAWVVNLSVAMFLAALGLAIAWFIALWFSDPIYRPKILEMAVKRLKSFYSLYLNCVTLIMLGVLGAYHSFRLFRKLQTKELEKAQLENSLSQARNQVLRMQLQPHFLFNTLNSISALIHVEPEAADKMVVRLADLLRLSLDTPVEQVIPLQKEIALIKVYLSIEQVRFQERLKVEIHVAPELAEAQVPSFILQPLVENALKHGISDRAQGGTIHIGAHAEGTWLVLEVQDDGTGFDSDREGIGLANTRSRLALIYKERQNLEIFAIKDKGTRVVLRIPL